MDTYVQAVSVEKRNAQNKVVEMLLPGNAQGSELMDASGRAAKMRDLRKLLKVFGVPKHSELEPDHQLAEGNGSLQTDCSLKRSHNC